MIRDPDLIHYACIARGTTVLAEFNSKDADLGTVAAKCLEKTPPLHSTFTHTVRSKTYGFLIDDPFVYFVIFDEKLEKSDGLAFLENVRHSFAGMSKRLESLSSHCFQGEFNPVFRQMLGSSLEHLEGIGSPMGQRGILHSISGPTCEGSKLNETKVKNRLLGDLNFGRKIGERNYKDENRGKASRLGREGLYSGELTGHQKAKKVWEKQVWVILSLDAIICVILFVVWLLVCRGFKCIDS